MKQNLDRYQAFSSRLVTRQQAAKYCSLSVQGFNEWVKRGRLPGAIPGTARWDLKAIDLALDTASGLSKLPVDAFDQWKASREARLRPDTRKRR